MHSTALYLIFLSHWKHTLGDALDECGLFRLNASIKVPRLEVVTRISLQFWFCQKLQCGFCPDSVFGEIAEDKWHRACLCLRVRTQLLACSPASAPPTRAAPGDKVAVPSWVIRVGERWGAWAKLAEELMDPFV